MKHLLCASAGLLLLAACRGDAPPETPPSEPVATVQTPAAEAPALVPTHDPTWGMAVPSGTSVDDRAPGVVHYRIRANWADLETFYATHFPDWERDDFERGARFTASDGSERAVYVYRDVASRSWVLSYFEQGTEPVAPSGDRAAQAAPADAAATGDSVAGRAADGSTQGGTAQGGTAQAGATQGGTPQTDSPQTGSSQTGAMQGGPAPGGTPQGGAASGGPAAGAGSLAAAGSASNARAGSAGGDDAVADRASSGFAARTYRSHLDDRIGAPTSGAGADGPAPLVRPTLGPTPVHPRLRDHVERQQQRPVRFIRGVHEPRRNPGARF